jgi:hypothetical protein
LPSSLTRDPSRLRLLASPTWVGFGYGFLADLLEAFLGSGSAPTLCPSGLAITAQGLRGLGFATHPPLAACTGASNRRLGHPSASPHCSNVPKKYWNINPLSIAYALRPQLRCRLTLGGIPCPGTLGFTARGFHTPFSVTHANMHTSHPSTPPSGDASPRWERSPTVEPMAPPAVSVCCLSPGHFRCHITRPVSCYAFFQGWLLLSQPPGCLGNLTPFATEQQFGDLNGRSGLLPSRP